jgi:hypothetical protein
MLELSGLHYPNRFGRGYVRALEQLLGHGAVAAMAANQEWAALLKAPDDQTKGLDFAYLAALNAALEEQFGAKGGRGMELRAGRVWFHEAFRTLPSFTGMSVPAFQNLPLVQRTELGIKAFAYVFNQTSDQTTQFQVTEDAYLVRVAHSPFAWGRADDRPVCHAHVGLLQEVLRWASGGYEYHVQETQCHAAGAEACIFRANKKALTPHPVPGIRIGNRSV